MDRKKLPFIRLSIVFSIVIIIAIFYSWGFAHKTEYGSGMMDQSMGDMMGENHLKNVTVRDLITSDAQDKIKQSEDNHSGHHDTENSFLYTLHKITTLTITVLIPFILAGTIFLMIIWFDKT